MEPKLLSTQQKKQAASFKKVLHAQLLPPGTDLVPKTFWDRSVSSTVLSS